MFDKVKGLVSKNKKHVTTGIDKASDVVEKKVGEEHADKVEKVAEQAKDAVEKLD